MIYIKLFLSFLQVGLFSIGGGYAAMPFIQSQVVDKNGWLTMSEFTDLITIAEMTPGPIAINSATFVGTRIAGVPGAIVASIGFLVPSLIIVTLFSFVYYKYKTMKGLQTVLGTLRPAVVALIASAGLSILLLVIFGGGEYALSSVSIIGCILFAVAFFVLRKFKLNPIIVMLLCGAVNLVVYLISNAVIK